jgi:hypothetical protein
MPENPHRLPALVHAGTCGRRCGHPLGQELSLWRGDGGHSHDEDAQWYDAVFLEYIGSKCRVLWEEVEPGQSPTALVDHHDVKER